MNDMPKVGEYYHTTFNGGLVVVVVDINKKGVLLESVCPLQIPSTKYYPIAIVRDYFEPISAEDVPLYSLGSL